MKSEPLNSSALAFWAKHCAAMDHLYEEYFDLESNEIYIASSLKEVVKKREYSDQVNIIIKEAIHDKMEFLSSVRRSIAKKISKSNIVTPRSMYTNKVSKEEWRFNLYLEKRSNKIPKLDFSFYVEIDTDRFGRLIINAKLYVGRKNSGMQLDELFSDELFKFKDPRDRKKKSITLFSKPFMDYKSPNLDSINLFEIENEILNVIRLISAPLWKKIIAL